MSDNDEQQPVDEIDETTGFDEAAGADPRVGPEAAPLHDNLATRAPLEQAVADESLPGDEPVDEPATFLAERCESNEPPVEDVPDHEPPVDEPRDEPPVEEPPADERIPGAPVDEPGDFPPTPQESTGVALSERSESNGPAGEPSDNPPGQDPGEPGPPERVADAQLKAVIEALIFASPEPITAKMLFKLLESEPKEDVQLALEMLKADYDRPGGLQLVEVANGYQIVTRAEMHEWVRRLFHERKTQKLSVQALETLAVIAYKQPITAPEIGEIRGVNTGGVINTLLERHLIKISGRKAVVGRPFLYSTTREFLIRFGLKDLGDLPKVEDLADVLGFEPPAGLTEGSADPQLPLEVEGGETPESAAAPEETAESIDEDAAGEPETVN